MLRTLARALMWVSLAVTLAKLSTDRGGGQYLFTLIAFVILSTLAPYWLSMRAMERVTQRRWALAIGAACCVFGLTDVTMRTIGFFFPTGRLDVRLAFWLPISSLVVIPFAALIAHTFIVAFGGGEATEGTEGTDSHGGTEERRRTEFCFSSYFDRHKVRSNRTHA